MRIRKAVIPAAGLGTRVLPATKAIPKEMLPLADTPTIQYIVDEAVQSGIEQITLITSRYKRAIEDHFDVAPELEAALAAKGKHEQLRALRAIEQMARFTFVRQQQPLGLGHAVLMAEDTVGREPFGVLLGDDLVVNHEQPCLAQLMAVHAHHRGCILAVMRVPRAQLSRYGVVRLADDETGAPGLHRVLDLVEKPRVEEAPSDLAIIGRYVLPPSIFDALHRTAPGAGGEIQLTDAIRRLAQEGAEEPVWAYEFAGTRYDTGDPIGLLSTSLAFALERPDLAPALRAFLRTLDLGEPEGHAGQPGHTATTRSQNGSQNGSETASGSRSGFHAPTRR